MLHVRREERILNQLWNTDYWDEKEYAMYYRSPDPVHILYLFYPQKPFGLVNSNWGSEKFYGFPKNHD